MEKNITETNQYTILSSDRQGGYIVKMKDGSGIAFVDKKGNIGKDRYASASIIKQHPQNIIEKIKFGLKDSRYLYSVRRISGEGKAWVTKNGKIIQEKGAYCKWTPDLISKLRPSDYHERYMLQTLENEVYYQLNFDAYEHCLDGDKEELTKRINETLKAFKEFNAKVEREERSYNIIDSSIENIKDKEQNINDANAKRYAEMSKTYAETLGQTDYGVEPSNE